MQNLFDTIENNASTWITELNRFGTNTLNWLSILVGHSVFVPTSLALLTALTDKTPSIDIIILVQGFLLLSFFRTVVSRDQVGMVLHALGWFVNALLLGLIVFK